MPITYELHFQEGFAGETVEILVDGAVGATFEATTRMQISLAHIERIALTPGQRLTIRIKGKDLSGSIQIEPYKTFIKINIKEDKLTLEGSEVSPGYL